ncbi:GL13407 [Drosophila persimilis]|uniref:GL13407 n=1 Tax=Drosophila persimilis TaxID=7234 RepID=B4H396_DROPE|nr:GL13407 [Drosophila persimilis]
MHEESVDRVNSLSTSPHKAEAHYRDEQPRTLAGPGENTEDTDDDKASKLWLLLGLNLQGLDNTL